MTPEPCNPDRLPADRLAFAEEVHQQFLQAFAQQLTTDLEAIIKATPAGIDQVPMADFLTASNTDACFLTFDLAPVRGQAWAGLSGGLVFRILDILLGAPQPSGPSGRGTITDIERNLLQDFFQTLRDALDRAWKPGGISLRLSTIGSAEDIRQTVDLEGTALVLNCKVQVGENESTFRVAIPVLSVRLAALESERLAAGEAVSEPSERETVLEAVSAASLELEAILSGSSIRLGDLAELQAGQILMLTRPAGSQLECLVNGKPKYRGEWIADGDRHGLHVDTLVDSAAGN